MNYVYSVSVYDNEMSPVSMKFFSSLFAANDYVNDHLGDLNNAKAAGLSRGGMVHVHKQGMDTLCDDKQLMTITEFVQENDDNLSMQTFACIGAQ